jgi:hypothetical protein
LISKHCVTCSNVPRTSFAALRGLVLLPSPPGSPSAPRRRSSYGHGGAVRGFPLPGTGVQGEPRPRALRAPSALTGNCLQALHRWSVNCLLPSSRSSPLRLGRSDCSLSRIWRLEILGASTRTICCEADTPRGVRVYCSTECPCSQCALIVLYATVLLLKNCSGIC